MDVNNIYIIQIPLKQNEFNYRYSTIIGDTLYILAIYYNRRMGRYILNISDENNNPLVMGIPLLVGSRIVKRFAGSDLDDIKYLSLQNLEDGKSEINEDNLSSAFLFTFKEIE